MTTPPAWPTPLIGFHIVVALLAVGLGPVAFTARKGSALHVAAGRTWVAAMALAALSAVFIHESRLPTLAGFSPIHLLIPLTLGGLWRGITAARSGRIAEHRLAMRITYVSACLVAGAFTLLPGRYLGDLLWHHALGGT